jgi:hypothetical protein
LPVETTAKVQLSFVGCFRVDRRFPPARDQTLDIFLIIHGLALAFAFLYARKNMRRCRVTSRAESCAGMLAESAREGWRLLVTLSASSRQGPRYYDK